jgi:hypothetical protein
MNSRRLFQQIVALTVFSLAIAASAFAQSRDGFTFNGVNHVSFQPSEYNTTTGTSSRTQLAGTHANWAAVLVTQYQANATATTISADANRTPTDAAVIAAIQQFHSAGMKVMLKPHVDSEDGAWRGTFQPSNVDAWFSSYTNFISHYATLAQQNGVEGMVMGTEFVQLSGSANQARWTSVINTIRGLFSGTLVYASNATFGGDEFTTVSFWDQLDMIGLDAYFPLTNINNPTQAQLIAAWSANKNGENVVANVQNFANAHPGKTLIFTEIGYRSVDGANTAPFDFGISGGVDDGEQRDCAEAMFQVWSTHTSFMKGLFWWDWAVPAPNVATDTDYTPQNKLAEGSLQSWFGTTATSNFALSANPSSLTINRGASGTSTITITRTSFTSAVTLSASGLPTGVTATFSPNNTTGNSSTLTLAASSTATLGGPVTVTITGTGGGLTRTTTITLTVSQPATPNFALAASPSSLTINRGTSGTSTISITRTSFTSAVTLSASGLPTGVTASFNPNNTTGNSSVLTLAASSTATLGGPVTVTITGIGGGLTRTTTVALTVASGSTGTGGVTVTPVVASSSGFFNEEDVKLANTSALTAMSITIVIQRTTGISFSGQYNTVGGTITQGNNSTASAATYTFTLNAGQTLGPGTNWTFAAQTSGTGTAHPTAGDTFTVTYTTGGQNFTQTGHF